MSHPMSIPPGDPSATTFDIARRDFTQLRHGRLGVSPLVFFVILAAAPMTAMAGGAPSHGNAARQRPSIPLAYVVAWIC